MTPDSNPSVDGPRGDDIRIVVNGDAMNLPAASTAFALLERLGLASKPLAVEINRMVVPRRQLGERTLADGDQLEIVTLVGGG